MSISSGRVLITLVSVLFVYFLFDRGIRDGFKDGFIVGKRDGFIEGFQEGLKSGKEYGARIGNSLVPLLQILQSKTRIEDDKVAESPLIESARRLLTELGNISLSNDEDPEKEAHLSQIEAKIKALTVNFSKKVKNLSINRINKGSQDGLSF